MSLLLDLLPALGLIVGALLLVRRFAQRGSVTRGAALRVTGRASINRTTTVAVVEVDGRRFLVGGGDAQLALLSELDAVAPEQVRILDHDAEAGRLDDRELHGMELVHAGPGNGLIDRLRAMTVRAAGGGPVRGAPKPHRG